jgi:PAS domain S-box-containing protein
MAGKNDAGFGKSAALQTLRRRAEEKVAADNKPFKNMSASEMSTLIHELRIHQIELEMQNEELRKSQAATERSRKAYQDLWTLSPAGYLIVDFAGRVIAVNRAAQRLFGRPGKALLNERLSSLVAPESQMPVHFVFERAQETGIVERQEIRILKPDSAIHICLLEVSSLGGQSGREQMQAVLIDITKQKRAEDDLRKSEREKKAILDSLMENVIYHDREMKILWANKAACESAHMKPEDLADRNCYEIWADRRTPCDDCPVIKARETGQPQMVEKMIPDGRWWSVMGHPVRDPSGHVLGMTQLALDITERKRAEEAVREAKNKLEMKVGERTSKLVAANEKLRQEIKVRNKVEKELQASEMLLSTTFAALQDLLIVIDKDLRVVISNWKDHDYIPENGCRGHPYCYEVYMNRKKPCNPCHAMEVFATGQTKQLEDRNPIDGKVRDIRVLPIFDDEGKVVAIVEHLRDITDQKQANEQIRSLSQQIIKAQEDERQMISRELHDRVAQDLSTVLIGLNTISDHLPNVTPEVQKKALEFSEILKETINVVRDLSFDLRLPGLDGIGLIPALSMYCKEFAEKHSLNVDFQSSGMKDLRLDFETEMNLYRLIQEGLNNIHKHAAASLATVKFVGTCPNIILRINDDGKGFDVEKRSGTAYSEKRMGLRSMAERVRLIQGEMTIQSQPMKGTRIFIKFPYQPQNR